ncbi:MAG: PKD domain-containing protein [Chitinophagaceae bacterium]
MRKHLTLYIFFFFFTKISFAQPCTNIGQTPGTAFPVCGTQSFLQTTVPICATQNIPVPCNDGASYQDKNPYWYKFTCYQAGTLGFVITPNNLNDDYDWQLFDITGQPPNSVFTNPGLFVACNWSGLPGVTGASNAGSSLINCAGNSYPLWSAMPTLIVGHEYLLLISHFTDSQSGYTLQFTGGSAVITDPVAPAMQSATGSCDGLQIRVKINKQMKCNSLAANGSDFSVAGATIVSAVGPSCSSGFDTDSIILTLSSPLPAGNYNLVAQNGSDGNTLLDLCGNAIPAGSSVPFTVPAAVPTPMDSLTPVGCAPNSLQLVFKRPLRCNSVAPNGSDFIVTGPQAVSVSAATVSCDANGFTSSINLQLSSAIVVGGVYTVTLRTGTDGNTIIDECGRQTPAGSTISFTTKDTVNADFTFLNQMGCTFDTLYFNHPGGNGINNWKWTFDNSRVSTQQNPIQIYSSSSQHTVKLVVTNGVCSDSTTQTITLDNKVMAAFETANIICPEDTESFKNTSKGVIDRWLWVFGNGNTSSLKDPPAQRYPITGTETIYRVKLVASSTVFNCSDSVTHTIRVLGSCYIAVPTAFTPNGDGLNDYLFPMNALKADNLDFKIFNRWGQLVFATHDWLQKWDGTVKGIPQPAGTYVWYLRYTHRDNGKKIFMKGTTVLIR